MAKGVICSRSAGCRIFTSAFRAENSIDFRLRDKKQTDIHNKHPFLTIILTSILVTHSEAACFLQSSWKREAAFDSPQWCLRDSCGYCNELWGRGSSASEVLAA
ncbi:hypothetical protein CDAR_10181 [Caerostris darwini]|uniref:Uncharacterized protein n=1 Tax=Caerostris darwini TaxID=1538125 RepID=A0AAV4RBZ1_9ARAC|nr:hypothetical protein CDAR_10181 [Caerostris darwini]